MAAIMSTRLCNLPNEVLFNIFDHLDRPSRISLGLTGPHHLQLLAKYTHFDIHYGKKKFGKKAKRDVKTPRPPHQSPCRGPEAYPAMVRWLSLSDVSAPHVLMHKGIIKKLRVSISW